MGGVNGDRVVLHRVGSDRAGPIIDSTRTVRDGSQHPVHAEWSRRRDLLRPATHDGIAYFSPPLDTGRRVDDAELAVFDTTSAPVPIHVLDITSRHRPRC